MGRAEKVRTEGDLVAHRAGEDEQGGGMSGQGGDVSFEGVGGRVVAEDVVEEGGVRDGVQHGGGGSCDDVAWGGREGSVNWECEGHGIGAEEGEEKCLFEDRSWTSSSSIFCSAHCSLPSSQPPRGTTYF